MTREESIEILELIAEQEKRLRENKISTMFTDDVRHLYPKHLEFFDKGNLYKQRLFLAANRIGKTTSAACELVYHLTGEYPNFWTGKRFVKATQWWVVGKTSKQIRDSIQASLLSTPFGTGLLPKNKIQQVTKAHGVADFVDTILVNHISGGTSKITLKSYDQGREAFQGSTLDGVWIDEEPPIEIYNELITRTMTTNGIVMLTMTPLFGLTELIQKFVDADLENEKLLKECQDHTTIKLSSLATIRATWDDAPHLSEQSKKELYEALPPHQRDARSKGVPQLGAGAIYPVPESEFVMQPMQIPKHYRKVFGMDVGWNRTAVVWAAEDPDTGVWYIYSEHYQGEQLPMFHAEAIKARGQWIPGVIDPASRGRGQDDGQKLFEQYRNLGLKITKSNNAVESGIYDMWTLLISGKLKVFSSCIHWLNEFRLYHRNEKGHIVKANDHLMDATRYFVLSGRDLASPENASVRIHNSKLNVPHVSTPFM